MRHEREKGGRGDGGVTQHACVSYVVRFRVRLTLTLTLTLALTLTLTLALALTLTPTQVMEAYTEHVGRMAPLPEWTQRGLILGMTGGQQRVLDRVSQLQQAGAPVVAVWLQVHTPMASTCCSARVCVRVHVWAGVRVRVGVRVRLSLTCVVPKPYPNPNPNPCGARPRVG